MLDLNNDNVRLGLARTITQLENEVKHYGPPVLEGQLEQSGQSKQLDQSEQLDQLENAECGW